MASRYWPALYFTAGASIATIFSVVYRHLDRAPESKLHRAPTETHLPGLSPEERAALPYPPDLIQGARDIQNPYGCFRMYEWGPVKAKRKIVLIHGISGACPALLGCAERLVQDGCRVMMIELFGRGWSGGPADLPYDGRLYCSQLFMALASSDISWTGEDAGRFTIVGYSLGGCIAVEFASWFPTLVEDLVLIAPAGLIRPTDPKTWLMYTDYLPERLTTQVVARRLRSGTHGAVRKSMSEQKNKPPEVEVAAAMPEKIPAINVKKINSEALMQWQMKHNAGFLTAFIGSVRDSPTRCQHELWQLLGHRINALRLARASSDESDISKAQQHSLASGKVLLCVGGRDPLIKPAELVPDAEAAIGSDNLEVKTFAGAGHEVGMSRGVEIAETALDFWSRNSFASP